ncbi:hypothetical protein ACFLW8_02325 [Chloroflexota bacterium]
MGVLTLARVTSSFVTKYFKVTSSNTRVLDVSEVVRVALHCTYRPIGNPEAIGEVPPTDIQLGEAASFVKRVSEALTSKVISFG